MQPPWAFEIHVRRWQRILPAFRRWYRADGSSLLPRRYEIYAVFAPGALIPSFGPRTRGYITAAEIRVWPLGRFWAKDA